MLVVRGKKFVLYRWSRRLRFYLACRYGKFHCNQDWQIVVNRSERLNCDRKATGAIIHRDRSTVVIKTARIKGRTNRRGES